jgi:hypothetical protein
MDTTTPRCAHPATHLVALDRGDHHDRDVAAVGHAAKFADEADAVHLRQLAVDHDAVELALYGQRQPFAAIADGLGDITLFVEPAIDPFAGVPVVFDDQNAQGTLRLTVAIGPVAAASGIRIAHVRWRK